MTIIKHIVKRDGRTVEFEAKKISNAVFRAAKAVGGQDKRLSDVLAQKIIENLEKKFGDKTVPKVEEVQDIVEKTLIDEGHARTAKAYILYRKLHENIRNTKGAFIGVQKSMDEYLEKTDWRVFENSNADYSFSGLMFHVSGKMVANYVLNEVYSPRVSNAHRNADIHIHDLGLGLVGYCCGWSLKELLMRGFGGAPKKIRSKPPKHLETAVIQMVNFLGTMQMEHAGAQAFSSIDTFLAPFAKAESLDYKKVKQNIQMLVFSLNVPSRWSCQAPFTNFTFDWTVPEDMKNQPGLVGGKPCDFTYGECQKEMDMINRAFLEVFLEGDADGRTFFYPIPTYNITKDFDWETENAKLLFELTAKYGTPYFQNFINSPLNPSDIRSMCLEENENVIVKVNEKINRKSIKEFTEENAGVFEKEWATPKSDVFALSLNPDSYKFEWAKVKSFYKTKSHSIVKITSHDGKSFKVSQDHPVAVYTPEGIRTQTSAQVCVGDFLITAKNASECLSGFNKKIRNYEFDEDFARFMGLFIAEGNYLFDSRQKWKGTLRGIQFSLNYKKEMHIVSLLSKFLEMRFGINAKIRKDPRYNTVYCYAYNKNLAELLVKEGFNKKGKLPEILFNSPASVIKAFVDGFAQGDGYEQGGEIHINDKELVKDLCLLSTIIGKHVTIRYRKNSQVLRFQHTFGRGSAQNILKNDILYNRVPQFIVKTAKDKPFYSKQFMVSQSAIEKHSAHTQESKKVLDSDFSIVRVSRIEKEENEKEFIFYDIELEKNHFFVHSLGSITHNCCRLQLDLKQLRNRMGGLFGAADQTGSIGVVTINLPRIGFNAKSEEDFFEKLNFLLDVSKESLETKRSVVEKNMQAGLMPFSREFLGSYGNHFSTIGINGMHEALKNFLGKGIETKEGKEFAVKVLDFIRNRLSDFQEETKNLYNLEASPCESATYRFAKKDRELFPSIITAGTPECPYYTNSTHLPVNFTDDVFEALEHQDELQVLYTGGTVVHGFLGERIDDWKATSKLVKKIAYSFKLPYFTITPTFSVCPEHGYIKGEHGTCPMHVENKKEIELAEVINK